MTNNIDTASTCPWFTRNWHAQLAFTYGDLNYHNVHHVGTDVCTYRKAVVKGLIGAVSATAIVSLLLAAWTFLLMVLWFYFAHGVPGPSKGMDGLDGILYHIGLVEAILIVGFTTVIALSKASFKLRQWFQKKRASRLQRNTPQSTLKLMWTSWKQKYCIPVTVDRADV